MNGWMTMISGYAGWLGALGTMGAYGLVSQRRLHVDSVRYQAINVVGAGLLGLSALSADNWPSLAANFAWMLIALASLIRSPRALAHALGGWGPLLRARVPRFHERALALRALMERQSGRLSS
jgi:hypothetical protein